MKNSLTQELIQKEDWKQKNSISLIASENITSQNVRNALSTVLTNKYTEGYPKARYYTGCEYVDEIETHCIDLVKKIFNVSWANVQPHSGSQANQAVFFALLNPGDVILSLDLKSGGHLTHGARVSSTFQNYKIVHYYVDENGKIDMQEVEKLAQEHKPKMIIAGASAYPFKMDFKKFRKIADLNNSYLLADIAHIAGLVASKVFENPAEHAHVLTSTTHKTLRGPRGGIVFSNDIEIGKKIDKALFPGVQGGPMMNTIAAKAVAFEEILQDASFQEYGKQVLKNTKILAQTFMNNGASVLGNSAENHLLVLNTKSIGIAGKEAEQLLEKANVYVSANAFPGDSWKDPSGLRIGTPYITTLGMKETEVQLFGQEIINALKTKNIENLKNFVINYLKRK